MASFQQRGLAAGISVHGLTEALRLLEFAPERVDEQLRASLEAVARPALREAESDAPRTTSALAASLRMKVNTRAGRVGVKLEAGGGKVKYAGVRMFGRTSHVSAHTRAGAAISAYTRALTPDPFLIRAGERHRAGAEQRVQHDLARILEEVFI